MSSDLFQCPKEQLRALAAEAGACAVGFAKAEAVDASAADGLRAWLAAGRHASMAYMERYEAIRLDPRLLLDGALTVISLAFSYRQPDGLHHPFIADYALGQDYHSALRRRLQPMVEALAELGAKARVCVDSAPILERYWAVRAGIGFVGRNHQLIVPNVGSDVLLAEIITTLQIEPDSACQLSCDACNVCISACPGQALCADGSFDARRCLSYLTIEHRGDLPQGCDLCGKVYGCDDCRRVCPHNRCAAPALIDEFRPDPHIMAIDAETLAAMSSNAYRHLTANSAMSRVPLKQLLRNAAKIAESCSKVEDLSQKLQIGKVFDLKS